MSVPSDSPLSSPEASTRAAGRQSSGSPCFTGALRAISLSFALLALLGSCGQTGELTRPETQLVQNLIAQPR